MFNRKSMLSKLLKILLYGIVNFVVILVLISITKFNSTGSIQALIQGQLPQICIIVFVTGLVDYTMINTNF